MDDLDIEEMPEEEQKQAEQILESLDQKMSMNEALKQVLSPEDWKTFEEKIAVVNAKKQAGQTGMEWGMTLASISSFRGM